MAIRNRRREILNRLFVLMGDLTVDLLGGPNGPLQIVPGRVQKNRNELQKDKVPGVLILDADEVRDPRLLQPAPGMQQSRMPAQIMRMTPEIYIVLDERGVENKNVGEDLDTVRLAILDRVMSDRVLHDIIGSNGNAIYDGCVTDLARNRTMKGQMGMSITFSYPLIVREYTS